MHDHCYQQVQGSKMRVMQKYSCPLCRTPFPNNGKESLPHLRKWVKAGKPWAMAMLGGLYCEGNGVERNEKLGFKFYMMSARRGFDNGCFNVAACYSTGRGPLNEKINLTKCLEWMRKAADKGHVGGIEQLPRIEKHVKNLKEKLAA